MITNPSVNFSRYMREIIFFPILSLLLSLCYTDKTPWKTLEEFENDIKIKVDKSPGPGPGDYGDTFHHRGRPKFKIQDGPTLWPGGRIPYKFADQRFRFSKAQKNQVRRAINEFHRKTCIRFHKRRKNERNFIKIVKISAEGERECSSYVGRTGGSQELVLSSYCWSKSTIIHELMHALGFYHEHSRKESRDYVRVKGSGDDNTDVHLKHHPVVRNSPYDICSIMHYGKGSFSDPSDHDRKCPHEMGDAKTFSKIDLQRLLKMYKCS